MYTIRSFNNTAALYFALYLSCTAQNKYVERNLLWKIDTDEQYSRAKPLISGKGQTTHSFGRTCNQFSTYKISPKRKTRNKKEQDIFIYVKRHPNNLMSFFQTVYNVGTQICQEHPTKTYWGRVYKQHRCGLMDGQHRKVTFRAPTRNPCQGNHDILKTEGLEPNVLDRDLHFLKCQRMNQQINWEYHIIGEIVRGLYQIV